MNSGDSTTPALNYNADGHHNGMLLPMEPTKEQMFRAYDEAPEVVRRALQPEGLAMLFVSEMADTYKVHVDVAGTISVLIRNMILGFLSPGEFSSELNKAGVPKDMARQLLADLNTKVFVPLRNQVREQNSHHPSQPPQVPVLSISKSSAAPEQRLQESSSTPSYNLMGDRAPKASPVAASTTLPSISPVSATVPTMRTMQHDMELVQHGSQPAPYPAPISQLHPTQATAARMFQTASVPVTAPLKPQIAPEIVHLVPDAARATPKQTAVVASAPEYRSDPYRESI